MHGSVRDPRDLARSWRREPGCGGQSAPLALGRLGRRAKAARNARCLSAAGDATQRPLRPRSGSEPSGPAPPSAPADHWLETTPRRLRPPRPSSGFAPNVPARSAAPAETPSALAVPHHFASPFPCSFLPPPQRGAKIGLAAWHACCFVEVMAERRPELLSTSSCCCCRAPICHWRWHKRRIWWQRRCMRTRSTCSCSDPEELRGIKEALRIRSMLGMPLYGELSVESKPGVGARFRLTLPCYVE